MSTSNSTLIPEKTLHTLNEANASFKKENIKFPCILSSYSRLDKLKEGIRLIFAGIAQFFQFRYKWTASESTPEYQSVDHLNFNGKLIGKEEIWRNRSVLQLLASKETQLDILMKQKLPSKKIITSLQQEIYNIKHFRRGQTWITANRLKEDLSDYHNGQKKGKFVLKPNLTYIPAIVNSHFHKVITKSESLSIHRSGPLSYLLDGSTNLMDLKEEVMTQWQDQIKADSFTEFRKKTETYLENQWDKRLALALETIEIRQRALDDQMVQYVANQVKSHISEIADPSRQTLTRLTRIIQLTQISLLDPLKAKKESSGLQTNERNQMLDMAALFIQFNGKQVEFRDIQAPFMNGLTIYLPLSFLMDPSTGKPIVNPDISKPFKLSCTLFNTSVQGLKVNEGEQKDINAYGIKQIEKNLKRIQHFFELHPDKEITLKIAITPLLKRLKILSDRFEKGETGYAIAKDLCLLQHDLQGYIGINCANGIDQTGYLTALIISNRLDHQIKQDQKLTSEEKKALKSKFQSDLMNLETGLASHIVHQNTGRRVLKIKEARLMGINEKKGFLGDFIHFGHTLLAFSR